MQQTHIIPAPSCSEAGILCMKAAIVARRIGRPCHKGRSHRCTTPCTATCVCNAGSADTDCPPQAPPGADVECPTAAYNFKDLANVDASARANPARTAVITAYHATVCATTLQHSHSDTCKRHGHSGVEGDCGMIFGRVQRRSFMWIGGSGSCVLPRYSTHAVPHRTHFII